MATPHLDACAFIRTHVSHLLSHEMLCYLREVELYAEGSTSTFRLQQTRKCIRDAVWCRPHRVTSNPEEHANFARANACDCAGEAVYELANPVNEGRTKRVLDRCCAALAYEALAAAYDKGLSFVEAQQHASAVKASFPTTIKAA